MLKTKETFEFICCDPFTLKEDHKNGSQEIPYPFVENGLSSIEKIKKIEYHFEEILKALGMDLTDDSLQKTPYRYAKMLVKELFQGLDEASFPTITTQENKFSYHQPLIESNISLQSICEHHFLPIIGHCHIAYIPKGRVIGLSKLNRIAQYFAKRPQVQERLTMQISSTLSELLETPDVAVVIDAVHFCVRMRGVKDEDSLTRTMDFKGAFLKEPLHRDFLDSIPKLVDLKL